METNDSDKSSSNDESNSKRPKMESDASTSSKHEPEDPFLSLPPDILTKIIGHIPIAQWHALELVDKNFRATTWMAWRQLRRVNLDREFVIRCETQEDQSSLGKSIKSILLKLVERSPFLTSLSGINIRFGNAELNSDVVQLLAQFEHLQSISLGDAKSFDDRPGIQLENLIGFLESTGSRATLKELQLSRVVQHPATRASILDQFALSFVNGRESRSSLKLEKFSLSSPSRSLHIFLDVLDTTRLTDVRLGKASIEPQQLIDLLERASHLRRIELAFLYCDGPCNGPRLEANKKLLIALASHERLNAIKFDRLGFNEDIQCTNFRPEFIDMLKAIGGQGILRKLELENYFVHSSNVNMDEICATIHDYIPYLESIKLNFNGISIGGVRNIAGLFYLEEMYINGWDTRMTTDIIKQISQLPRLKRLALNEFTYEDENSLAYLADAKLLKDLRIGYFVSAHVFEKWSEGIGSNLEILMLDEIATWNCNDEERLVRLLEKATSLRVLIVEGRVTDQSLMTIARSCPNLETMGVRSRSCFNNEITIGHLQEILDRCPKLKRFGGFGDEVRKRLQFPKYRKIDDVDVRFWKYGFEDSDY